MKRYIRSAIGYRKELIDEVRSFAENNDNETSDVGFEYKGQWITNPFVDPTMRFELSDSEAIKKYGRANIDKFIRDALEEMYGESSGGVELWTEVYDN